MKNLKAILFLFMLLLVPLGAVQAAAATPASEEAVEEQPQERFQQIYADDEYNYYIDTATLKLTQHPYKAEKLVDVWLKLEHNSNVIYSDSPVYILQHYYMRQNDVQQQLVSEVIVNSDENSTSEQRAKYSEANWNNLIPGTSEEGCYQEVMNYVKKHLVTTEPKKKKILGIF